MSDLEDVLKDLAEHARPWAKLWVPIFRGWGEKRLARWLDRADADWQEAYADLVESMTVDQKISELKQRQAELKNLNGENARFVAAQKGYLWQIIARAVMLAT